MSAGQACAFLLWRWKLQHSIEAHAGVEALGIFTVSDNIVTGAKTTPEERQHAFTTMMELALPLAQQ